MDEATVYSRDPAAQARAWQDAGCEWLHVVDLNGAFAGRPVNAEAVAAILDAARRSGPARRRHPRHGGRGALARSGRAPGHPGQRRGQEPGAGARGLPRLSRAGSRSGSTRATAIVATEGWAESSGIAALELALRFEDAGVAAIIYTDIGRDGMLGGLNIEATLALAARLQTPVIASGGVGSLDDLRALADRSRRRGRAGSRASSSAARCTTAGSTRPRRSPCFAQREHKRGICLDNLSPRQPSSLASDSAVLRMKAACSSCASFLAWTSRTAGW